jgi:hypothetical protein
LFGFIILRSMQEAAVVKDGRASSAAIGSPAGSANNCQRCRINGITEAAFLH